MTAAVLTLLLGLADLSLGTGNSPVKLNPDIGDHESPSIDGDKVVWQGSDGNDGEIFRYDGSTVTMSISGQKTVR